MKKITVLCISAIFVLAACNPSTPENRDSAIQTAIAQTQAIEGPLQTMAAQTAAASVPTATLTPTEVPIPTSTNTPEPPPSAITTANTSCRSGPGDVYPIVVVITEGETLMIDGQNEDQTWWRVQPPDNDPCWLPADAVGVSGNTNRVAILPIPPTPGPVGTSLVIKYGQTLAGEFTAARQKYYYAFFGRAGDNISVLLSSTSTYICVDIHYPSIGIESGIPIGSRCNQPSTDQPDYRIYARVSNYVLRNNGYYYIAVMNSDFWELGKFTLTLTKN